MNYNLALKMEEILSYETTQMNLGDVILNEVSQSQKDKYCFSPLM